MKRNRASTLILAAFTLMLLLQGCGEGNPDSRPPESSRGEERTDSIDQPADAIAEDVPEPADDEAESPSHQLEEESAASTEATEIDATATATQAEAGPPSSADGETGSLPDEVREEQENTMYLRIGDQTLTATLVENSSTAALRELLGQGPVTIHMRDYGNFEKVGELGANLPTNDVSITTEPGDLILYQGNSFVIYYAPNSWSFTRLGKINDVTGEELKAILGSGNVSVTLSLN